jgi:hypothetical protein
LVGGIVLWRRQHKAGQQRQIPAPLLQGVASMRVGVTLATFCLVLTTAPTERTSGIDVGCRDIRDPRRAAQCLAAIGPSVFILALRGLPPAPTCVRIIIATKKTRRPKLAGSLRSVDGLAAVSVRFCAGVVLMAPQLRLKALCYDAGRRNARAG